MSAALDLRESELAPLFAKRDMPPLFLLLLILSFVQPLSMDPWIQALSQRLQSLCVASNPHHQWEDPTSAIVCGQNLTDPQLLHLFRMSGLIHLLVVSASHLHVLQRLLSSWPKIAHMVLVIFTLTSGAQPPVIRSLICIGCSLWSRQRGLNWSPLQIQILSGAISLFLIPHWHHSLSFYLSWVTGITLSLSRFSNFVLCTLIYLLIAPLLGDLGLSDPLSILLNALLAPIMGMLLFPVSAITFLFPPLLPISEFLWSLFIAFLKVLQPFLREPQSTNLLSPHFRLAYVVMIALGSYIYERLIQTRNSTAAYNQSDGV